MEEVFFFRRKPFIEGHHSVEAVFHRRQLFKRLGSILTIRPAVPIHLSAFQYIAQIERPHVPMYYDG